MIDKGQMADVDKYSRAIIEYKSALNSEQADGFVDRSNNHKLKIWVKIDDKSLRIPLILLFCLVGGQLYITILHLFDNYLVLIIVF